jgi:undecaprenyl pyrophosphate phosphatase UppP
MNWLHALFLGLIQGVTEFFRLAHRLILKFLKQFSALQQEKERFSLISSAIWELC